MRRYLHAKCSGGEDRGARDAHLINDSAVKCDNCGVEFEDENVNPPHNHYRVAAHVVKIGKKQRTVHLRNKVFLITTCQGCNISAARCTLESCYQKSFEFDRAKDTFLSRKQLTDLEKNVYHYAPKDCPVAQLREIRQINADRHQKLIALEFLVWIYLSKLTISQTYFLCELIHRMYYLLSGTKSLKLLPCQPISAPNARRVEREDPVSQHHLWCLRSTKV